MCLQGNMPKTNLLCSLIPQSYVTTSPLLGGKVTEEGVTDDRGVRSDRVCLLFVTIDTHRSAYKLFTQNGKIVFTKTVYQVVVFCFF